MTSARAATAIATIDARASNDDERYVARTLRVKLLAASPATSQSMTALIEPLEQLIADPRTPEGGFRAL